MFTPPPKIEACDEVQRYGEMCDDLIPVSFRMKEMDGIYEARFTMESSFEHSVDERSFRQHVKDCHSVTDDNFDCISVISDPQFDEEFDLITGTYKISVEHGD